MYLLKTLVMYENSIPDNETLQVCWKFSGKISDYRYVEVI